MDIPTYRQVSRRRWCPQLACFSRYMVSEGRAQSGRRPATVVSGTWLGAPNGKGIGYNTCVLGAAFAKTDVAPPCYTLTCSSPRPRHGSDTQVLGTAARAVAPLFSFMLTGTFML